MNQYQLGKNICNRKILKEFNYESNRENIVRIIVPLFKKKNDIFDFVHTLSSANIDQSAPNLGKIFVQQNLNEFDHGSSRTRTTGVNCS